MYTSILKSTLLGLFALGCILAVSPPVHADNLGTIDVTAERQASPTAASSVPVTVIDRKTIVASHARNVAELLQGQPDIVVRDTSGIGVKPTVDLGGFGESAAANSIILVDGRRVNSPDLSGVDWNQIPLDQVERIEILHGGGASLYGAGAVGGVINIITRIPEAGGHVAARVGSFDSSGMQASLGADSGRTRIEGNVSSFNTKGYRVNGGYHRFDGGFRAESDPSPSLNLRLSGNYHHDRMGLPGDITFAQMSADRRQALHPYDFSRTDDGYMDAGLGWHNAAGFGIDIDGGVRRRKVHAEYISSNSTGDSTINTRSLRPKFSFETGSTVRVHALVGADLQMNDGSWVWSGAFPSATDFNRFRKGLYGHLHLAGDRGRWNLSGGLRSASMRDRFGTSATNVIHNRETAWDVGGSFTLVKHVLVRLNMERSVRFPLLDERFSVYSGLNTALMPQVGRHVGGSLRYTWGNVWVEGSFRRADLTDEIYYNPKGGAFGFGANENYASGTRHDVWMLTGHWHASDLWQWSASYTDTAARFRSGTYAGHWIPAVPQHRADIGWTADWTKALQTMLNLRYIGASYLISDQANAGPKLPGYAVADAVINYRWQDMQMFARVNNLLNRKYSAYGVTYGTSYYYPAAGIAVSAGADYRF